MKKDNNLYRVELLGSFDDANTAAFLKRAIQQEANEREDDIEMIQRWEDLNIDDQSDMSDFDDEEHEYQPDPMQLDSPDERRAQLGGFKAELVTHAVEIQKSESVLGVGALADFDADMKPAPSEDDSPEIREIARFPECSINSGRDKPIANLVGFNHLLGLEGLPVVKVC